MICCCRPGCRNSAYDGYDPHIACGSLEEELLLTRTTTKTDANQSIPLLLIVRITTKLVTSNRLVSNTRDNHTSPESIDVFLCHGIFIMVGSIPIDARNDAGRVHELGMLCQASAHRAIAATLECNLDCHKPNIEP